MRIGKLGLGALLYGALAFGANALAGELGGKDIAELEGLRGQAMQKLVIHPEPRAPMTAAFRDKYGNEKSLTDWRGKVVLLNFWATWCPPCRAEMPSIDRLAGTVGDDIAVLALSTDRFDVERIVDFFGEIGVENLDVLQDRRGALAREAGILGLPVTVILDREGREVARLVGDAVWDSPEARRILSRLAEMTAETSRAALE